MSRWVDEMTKVKEQAYEIVKLVTTVIYLYLYLFIYLLCEKNKILFFKKVIDHKGI